MDHPDRDRINDAVLVMAERMWAEVVYSPNVESATPSRSGDLAASDPLRLIAGAGLLQLSRLGLRVRLLSRRDGWRRAAGLILRSPRSTFVLSAFGLDIWADRPEGGARDCADHTHFSGRLHAFLESETEFHVSVKREGCEHRIQPCGRPSYTLAFQAWEHGSARFVPPRRWIEPGAYSTGAGAVLHFVCRAGPAGHADLWVRVDHVAADGVPVQDMLGRLEATFGVAELVEYPAPSEVIDGGESDLDSELAEAQVFVDFGPLLAWRKKENSRISEPMTVSAAMVWRLGNHPAFAPLHIGSTVEVEALDGLKQGVGVVVMRPADYRAPRGLSDYVRDFNARIRLTRGRASTSCKTLDAAAHLPPTLARVLLRHALERDPRAFGTMALTIIKDAKVFGAPIAEFGHPHGFVAVGSVALPTKDGRRVGCVTMKGPANVIARYPALIQEAF